MFFCMKINIKVFYKLTASFLLIIARYAQSTQNSNCVISLQYLKKQGGMKLVFCMQITIKAFLLVDPINLGGHGQTCRSYQK